MTGHLLDWCFAPRVSMCTLLAWGGTLTLLAHTHSAIAAGISASALLGFGLSSEADVTPDLIARYCVLKNFSMLYGLSWIAYAFGAAIGPVIVGSSFDRAGGSDQLHQAVFSALQGRSVSHSLPAAIRPTASR